MDARYEIRNIAFIDLLGFSAWVENSQHDAERVSGMVHLFEKIQNYSQIERQEFGQSGIRLTNFSDSVLLSSLQSRMGMPILLER